MATLRIGDADIHYEVDGPEGAPWVTLSNSLGTDASMWDGQMADLTRRFRVLRSDSRGAGRSATPPGPISMARLGRDVLALLDHLGVARTHWVGVSKGGMVGQWLLANHPDRIGRAVLANTAAAMPGADAWNARIHAVHARGMATVAPQVLKIWFSPGFSAATPEAVAAIGAVLAGQPSAGYAALCGAIRDMDQREAARAIRNPVLVVVGAHDPATPPAAGRALAAAIRGAKVVSLEAAHLSNVEQPEAFNRAVVDFLTAPDPDAEDPRHAAGMAVRRAVLGDAWVDRANASRTPFTAEFQAFITRTAWGDVWTRPGLDRKARSIVVLATTVALGAWDEFRLHVRAAINNGLTRAEISEILLQCAIYSGVPAANHAFKEAQSVLAEIDAVGRPAGE